MPGGRLSVAFRGVFAQAGAVYGMAGVVVGGLISAGALVWNGRRTDRTEQRNTSGMVDTSDAQTVFANQIAVLDAERTLRQALTVLVEKCQGETEQLKVDMRDQDDRYRVRIDKLEATLLEMTEQLRRGK